MIKQSHRLNNKSLHPHDIKRQNVKLVLRIFCDTTDVDLKSLGQQSESLPNWEGTVTFLNIVLKILTIVNVKTIFKDKHERLNDAHPISDISDTRISWMVDFVTWLHDWAIYSVQNKTTCFTNETFTAHFDYGLLGKFQTDS